MAKKFLCVITLLLTIVCMLASCSGGDTATPAHTHSYGEWETTREATCTTEGSKERYCSCGEKQSTTIPPSKHSIINGVCNICGFKNNTNDSDEPQNQTVTKTEWATIFDINKYQSYTMQIDGIENTQDGFYETVEISVEFKHPYFRIVSLQSEGINESDGWLNTDESTAFITGGIEELKKTVYIPDNFCVFYETISNLDDFGYSKFIFNSENNKCSSSLFDGFESVEISIKNSVLDSIVLTKEYCDLDWGDKTETYTLKLSNINKTPKPELPKEEVNSFISEAKDNIDNATKACKNNHSGDYYDIEESILTFNTFMNNLLSQYNDLNHFESFKYSWTDYELDEYEEETYVHIIISCPEKRCATIFDQNVNYDKVCITIVNGNITNIQLYSDSTDVFTIYFLYE